MSSKTAASAGPESLDKPADDEPVEQIELSSLLDEKGEFRTVQVRGKLDDTSVAAYRELLERGGKFKDPIIVYEVTDKGGQRFLAAGWHRSTAAQQAGLESLPGHLRPGTWLEALRAAIATNAEHGHRPTVLDVAATLVLLDRQPEYANLPNGDKAGLIGCSATTIANAYAKLGGRTAPVIAQRNGATYPMKSPSSHGVRMPDSKGAEGDGAAGVTAAMAATDAQEMARALRNLARRALRLMEELDGGDGADAVLSAYTKGQDRDALDSEREAVRWLAGLLDTREGR